MGRGRREEGTCSGELGCGFDSQRVTGSLREGCLLGFLYIRRERREEKTGQPGTVDFVV